MQHDLRYDLLPAPLHRDHRVITLAPAPAPAPALVLAGGPA